MKGAHSIVAGKEEGVWVVIWSHNGDHLPIHQPKGPFASIYKDNIAKECYCPAEERDRNMAISGLVLEQGHCFPGEK